MTYLTGIPTALTNDETMFLMNIARDKRVYEAGALLGHSTVALAQTAKHVVSVDPHDGYPRRSPSPTWNLFLTNLSAYGVKDRITPIRSKFQSAPPSKADFAFADLTGQRSLTEEFLRMTHDIRLVAFHDYERVGCEGERDAIDHYIHVYRPKVHRVHTLILLEKSH